MKIKFFSDFCTSEVCKTNFERTCKTSLMENYGEDKEIYITCADDYSHAVILNKATPDLKIPKCNVLGLACEPFSFLNVTPDFIAYAEKHIGKYFIGDLRGLGAPFIENHGYMWFDHPEDGKKIQKNKVMSIVFSQKNFAPGHQYRRDLVSFILQNNFPIDIYGRGCDLLPDNFKKDPRVKGAFKCTEPYDDYLFTISIENFPSNQYFSEKIVTPIMCNTIPVYLGCKNISQHVKDHYIQMSGNCNDDMKLVQNILKNPFTCFERVRTSKQAIFDELNLMKNITNLF